MTWAFPTCLHCSYVAGKKQEIHKTGDIYIQLCCIILQIKSPFGNTYDNEWNYIMWYDCIHSELLWFHWFDIHIMSKKGTCEIGLCIPYRISNANEGFALAIISEIEHVKRDLHLFVTHRINMFWLHSTRPECIIGFSRRPTILCTAEHIA